MHCLSSDMQYTVMQNVESIIMNYQHWHSSYTFQQHFFEISVMIQCVPKSIFDYIIIIITIIKIWCSREKKMGINSVSTIFFF